MTLVGEGDVLEFVARYTGCPIGRIDPDYILRSTGSDGDDAFELIEAFSEKFAVDLEGYDWVFHHNDEGALSSASLVRGPHGRVTRIPLTTHVLVEAARTGRWPVTYPAYQPMNRRWDLLLSLQSLLLAVGLLGGLLAIVAIMIH